MRRGQPEFALQCAIADYLRLALQPEVLWSAIGHGGGGAIRGARLKRMGLLPGIGDLMICWDISDNPTLAVHTLWIEAKALKGRLAKEQLAFRDRLPWGHGYEVCRSLAELAEILEVYGVPTRKMMVSA